MREAAARCDVHEILRLMREHSQVDVYGPAQFFAGQKPLAQALAKLRERGAAAVVETILMDLLIFKASLLFRSIYGAVREIQYSDAGHRKAGDLPESVVQEALPRVDAIEQSIHRTIKVLASSLHTLRLSEANGAGQGTGPRVLPLRDRQDDDDDSLADFGT
jgi:hypothetical protein